MRRVCKFFFPRWVTVSLLLVFASLTFIGGGATRSDPIWAIQDALPEFDAVLWMMPPKPKAGDETVIDVSIRYGLGSRDNVTPGDPVQNLQTLYGRTVELFILSENLHHFVRLRPEQFSAAPVHSQETATFQIRHRFPWAGMYRVVVTFAYRGDIYHKQFDLAIDGNGIPAPRLHNFHRQNVFEPDEGSRNGEPTSHFYRISLEVDPEHPEAGQKVEFRYIVHDAHDRPIRTLQVFEGTEMRVAFIRDDLKFFGIQEPEVVEDSASIPIVPRVATTMLHGRGVLRDILPDGQMLIDHGPIKDLVSISGTLRFRVADPDAERKVAPGDWVEFWIRNELGTGLLITRIEPLSTLNAQQNTDNIRPSPNHPIFPGPVVPIRHVFPEPGVYIAYGQLMHEDRLVTTKFAIEVGNPDLSATRVLDTVDDQPVAQSRLTAQELNGMRIYNSSTSQSGHPIRIQIGNGALFPANTVTCASCHGSNGRGRREGGAVAVDIRHDTITRSYVRTTESGRSRSPYSDALLRRAIVEGVDSDGNVLDFTMPRWEMSDQDLEDLVAFLQRLGHVSAPGVSTDTIRIGTVLDLTGPLAKTGAAVRHVFERVFDNVNRGQRVYGRSIVLVVADGRNDRHHSLAAAKTLVEQDQVLALVGNLGDAATQLVIPFLEAEGIPLIAPLAPALRREHLESTQVFSIYPSLGYQARILIDHAIREGWSSVAVLYSDDPFGRAGLFEAREQLELHGVTAVQEIPHQFGRLDVTTVVRQLQASEADAVLLLTGDPAVVDLIAAADRLAYSPVYMGHNLLVNGAMLQIPRAGDRLIFSQNVQFGSSQHHLVEEFVDVLRTSPGTERERVMQLPAFAAAKVLVDGLRNAGEDLTRESLVHGLERVRVDTGVLGTLHFSPQNHVGVTRMSLVKPDGLRKVFVPVADGREPLASSLSRRD